MSLSSATAGRRKRAAPKPTQPAPPTSAPATNTNTRLRVLADDNIPIAVAREAYAAAEATRPVDPPLTTLTPHDLAASVTTLVKSQLSKRIPRATTPVTVPTEAVEALAQQAATAAVAVLAAGWPRVVEEEHVRHTAATLLHVQRAGVAAEWNRRSRPVAVMGAPGMGYGFNVLPFLRRSVEGRAMHATSEEIRGACRRTKWKQGVCWAWSVVLYVYCVCLVFSLCFVFVCLLLLFGSVDQGGARPVLRISGF
jgi:hypothetical protein